MQNYDVHRSFGVWTTGMVAELDPDDAGTHALLRDGYITPVARQQATEPKPRPRRKADDE